MKISRRDFLKATAFLGGGAVMGFGGGRMLDNYFYNSEMKFPSLLGHTLFDLHTHIAKNQGLENVLKKIVDVGGVGTSLGNPDPWENRTSSDDEYHLCYDRIVGEKIKGIGVEEIDKKRYAKVDIDGKIGYLINVQEITPEEKFHILAIGCDFEFVHGLPLEIVAEMVHKNGGLLQINHAWTITADEPGFNPYRAINEKEEEQLGNLIYCCDLFEEANAQQIDLVVPGFLDFLPVLNGFNARERNVKAMEFVKEKNMGAKATRNSDTHTLIEQIGVMGNFIPNEYVNSWEGLRYALENGLHKVSDYQEVSRISFVNGMNKFKGLFNLLAGASEYM